MKLFVRGGEILVAVGLLLGTFAFFQRREAVGPATVEARAAVDLTDAEVAELLRLLRRACQPDSTVEGL